MSETNKATKVALSVHIILHDLCHKYPQICGRVFQRWTLVEVFLSPRDQSGRDCRDWVSSFISLSHTVPKVIFLCPVISTMMHCFVMSSEAMRAGNHGLEPPRVSRPFLNELAILALCYNEMKLTNILDLCLSDCLRNKDWHQNKGFFLCLMWGIYASSIFLKLQAIHTLFETDLKTCINTFK